MDEDAVAYLATGAGVAVVRLGGEADDLLGLEAEHVTGYGPTRRVAGVPGGVVGITGDGRAFRLDRDGRPRWERRLPAPAVAVAATTAGDRVLVATTVGAVELDAADGRVTHEHRVAGPALRAALWLPSGNRVLVTRAGTVVVLHGGDGSELWRYEQGEYPERAWPQDGRIYLAGQGGIKEIAVGEGVVCRWSPPGSGALTDAVVVHGTVYACSPAAGLTAYEYATGRALGPVREVPRCPGVIAAGRDVAGAPFLLVGHRGGLVSAYPADGVDPVRRRSRTPFPEATHAA